VYDGGCAAPSLCELGSIVRSNSLGFTVRIIEMELVFVHTVCRNGRERGFVMHTVHRDGRHVGGIEFGNFVLGALGVMGRRGSCIGGGQPWNGDRFISGGGQVWVDDLDAGGGAQVVLSHCASKVNGKNS
jgi:hypothetical protein